MFKSFFGICIGFMYFVFVGMVYSLLFGLSSIVILLILVLFDFFLDDFVKFNIFILCMIC